QIASSSVMFSACIAPTRRRSWSPSSRASTVTGPLIAKLRRAHFGITCSQVSLTFVAPQKTHAFVAGNEVTAGRDMAGSYGGHPPARAGRGRRGSLAGEQQL